MRRNRKQLQDGLAVWKRVHDPIPLVDVISFTDIIDVYPDRKTGCKNGNVGFCLLLVASCPPPPSVGSTQINLPPVRTRILSLAAPTPEAMRVWVDALFTCAGAYLCLPNSTLSQSHQETSEQQK